MVATPRGQTDTLDGCEHLHVGYDLVTARGREGQFALIRSFAANGQCPKAARDTRRYGQERRWLIGTQRFVDADLWTGDGRGDARF